MSRRLATSTTEVFTEEGGTTGSLSDYPGDKPQRIGSHNGRRGLGRGAGQGARLPCVSAVTVGGPRG